MRRSTPILVATLMLAASTAQAASFACAKAKAADERAICFDPTLSDLDSRLAALLELDEGTAAMGERGEMQDQQAAWTRQRATCGANRACLLARYQTRLKQVGGHLTLRLCRKAGPPC